MLETVPTIRDIETNMLSCHLVLTAQWKGNQLHNDTNTRCDPNIQGMFKFFKIVTVKDILPLIASNTAPHFKHTSFPATCFY